MSVKQEQRAQTCTACEGAGWYIVGDWKHGYPKGTCKVCRGSGRMERQPDGKWGPANPRETT